MSDARAVWPASIFEIATLRALDARARADLSAAGALSRLRAGQYVYHTYDVADAIFVVVEGVVDVHDAGGTTLKRARKLEAFGEDALTRISSRRTHAAVCVEDTTVARLPSAVLARAFGRLGVPLATSPRFAAMRRAAVGDALGAATMSQGLSPRDLGALIESARVLTVARGRAVYRAGEAATHAYFVAEGGVSLADGGYVGAGAVFGFIETLARKPRAADALAVASTWLLSLPLDVLEGVALRNPSAFSKPPSAPVVDPRNAHRFEAARSLLVINQDACVRCGNCVSSCASVHDDGIPRFARRGDVVRLSIAGVEAPTLLPSSCHHCESAVCLTECPTGAITRKLTGEVVLREDLCTGCGACVKACPWDNLSLVTKAGRVVASKCDLCESRAEGPACVAACPVGAASRIHSPSVLKTEAASAGRAGEKSAKIPANFAPFAAAVAGAAAVFAALSNASARASGGVLAASLTVAASYGLVKRARLLRALQPAYTLHLVVGALTVGAAAGHLRPRIAHGLNGALAIATVGTLVTGIAGWLVFRSVPRALTRLEPVATEDASAGAAGGANTRSLLSALTGQSGVLKSYFRDVLSPYAAARPGWLSLLASGRSLEDEHARLQASATATSSALSEAAAAPMRQLIRLSVATRAAPARRVLGALLAGWLPVHVFFAVIAVALATVHVIIEMVCW